MLEKHVSPYGWCPAKFRNSLRKGTKMLSVQFCFSIGATLFFELFNPQCRIAFAELLSFVSSDMNEIRTENVHHVVNEAVAEY